MFIDRTIHMAYKQPSALFLFSNLIKHVICSDSFFFLNNSSCINSFCLSYKNIYTSIHFQIIQQTFATIINLTTFFRHLWYSWIFNTIYIFWNCSHKYKIPSGFLKCFQSLISTFPQCKTIWNHNYLISHFSHYKLIEALRLCLLSKYGFWDEIKINQSI